MLPLFPTTIAGSLPKPAWLAEPEKLWAPWKLEGAALAEGKRDAVRLALAAGAPNIERVDRLVQSVAAQRGMRSADVDEIVKLVDGWLVRNRRKG